jgi:hypothetical protein
MVEMVSLISFDDRHQFYKVYSRGKCNFRCNKLECLTPFYISILVQYL